MFEPNSKFLVKHFLEIQEALPEEADEISFSSNIGVRGKAVIAAFTDNLFKGDSKDFAKRIASMPMAASKSLLTDILNKGYKVHITEKIDEEMKSVDEVKVREVVKQSFDGKPIRFTVVLPVSKKKVGVTPITELGMKKAKTLSRIDTMLVCLQEINGEALTKDGAKDLLENLPYVDFEYMYLYLSNINANISKLDWDELLKNF
ncbi:MAG: hypothetical protein WC517_03110 [Patescibacteria group bacterium]